MPLCAPFEAESSKLEAVCSTTDTPTEKFAPVPTAKRPVGWPESGSTDQRRVPVGEYLSTTWP